MPVNLNAVWEIEPYDQADPECLHYWTTVIEQDHRVADALQVENYGHVSRQAVYEYRAYLAIMPAWERCDR